MTGPPAHVPTRAPTGFTDTTFRLVLLSATCVTASVFAWSFVAAYLRGQEFVEAAGRCAGLPTSTGAGQVASPNAVCFAPYYLHYSLIVLLGLACTGIASVAVFAAVPSIDIARRRLRVAGADTAATTLVAAEAARLSAPVPRILVDPARAGATGRVFAGFGRPTLVLSFGMLPLGDHRPAAFRAVVAHELAHIENGDARKTEAAVAAWWGLVLAALVPYVVTVVAAVTSTFSDGVVVARDSPLPGAAPWGDVLRIAAITAVAVLIRNAVLRVREFAADRYAADRLDAEADLRELFSTAPGRPTTLRARLLSVHPPTGVRLDRLDDPLLGTAVSPWESFILGLLAQLPAAALAIPLAYLSHGRFDGTTVVPLISTATTAVMGVGLWALLWRATTAGTCPPRARLVAGVSLGLGQAVSLLLTPGTGGEPLFQLLMSPLPKITATVQVIGWAALTMLVGAVADVWVKRIASIPTCTAGQALTAGGVAAAAASACLYLILYPFTLLARGLWDAPVAVGDFLVGGTAIAALNGFVWGFGLLAACGVLVGRIRLRAG